MRGTETRLVKSTARKRDIAADFVVVLVVVVLVSQKARVSEVASAFVGGETGRRSVLAKD